MCYFTRFVACAIATAALVAQSGQDTAADIDRLVKAPDIHGGSIVGEIGAGDGALTVAIGKAVGDAGRVFSNELSKDRLAAIGKAVDEAGLKNVTTIEGAESETRFTDQCCDAIFMRDVYHHFSDPTAMNASIYRSLKPGGGASRSWTSVRLRVARAPIQPDAHATDTTASRPRRSSVSCELPGSKSCRRSSGPFDRS